MGNKNKASFMEAFSFKEVSMSKELLPHQQRVADEHAELSDKIAKLEQFIQTIFFQELEPIDKVLLAHQLGVMKPYQFILQERIKRF